jgi:hypothetical protein
MKLNYAIIKYSPKTTPSAILERVQNRNDNTFGRLNWNKSAAQYEKEKIVIYFERNAGTTTYEDINKCKDEIQEIYAENCVFTIRSNCIPSSAEQTQDCYSHPILVFGETNLLMEDDEEEEYGENYNMAILTFDKKIQDEKNEILTGKITLLEELEMRKLVNILASHAFVDDEEGTNFRAQFPSLENYSNNVRFCLICNYISKIDEPLKNEFISVRFNQLPQKDIIQFIETIIKKEDIKIAKNDIYTIQSMYKSDIRSMINFLQLNQNFKLNEWKKNILNPEVLDKLHNMFYTKLKQDDIINEIYNISRHYNIDKKHLIHCYLNHIVRLKLIPITENTIDIIKKTVHSVNADMEDVIIYLIESLKTIDFKPFPYVSVSSA